MFEKCPICNGTGKILNIDTTSKYHVCKTCSGTGIISQLTGLPPSNNQFVDLSNEQSLGDTFINFKEMSPDKQWQRIQSMLNENNFVIYRK